MQLLIYSLTITTAKTTQYLKGILQRFWKEEIKKNTIQVEEVDL